MSTTNERFMVGQRWTLHQDGTWSGHVTFPDLADTVKVMAVAECREVIQLLSDALAVAMVSVQDHVDGHGPRGVALLPLLSLADKAADARDALLSEATR